MWGHLIFVYEALNQTMPDLNALNRTMQSQTKVCITKSSSEIGTHLRYYTEQSCNSLSMFQDNLSVPSVRYKKSKRPIRVQMKLNDRVFFFGILSII